jgi:hypothetical protein
MFGPKKDKINGERRKLHEKELLKFYPSYDWDYKYESPGGIHQMVQTVSVYKILVERLKFRDNLNLLHTGGSKIN